jgi:hypothetical protein
LVRRIADGQAARQVGIAGVGEQEPVALPIRADLVAQPDQQRDQDDPADQERRNPLFGMPASLGEQGAAGDVGEEDPIRKQLPGPGSSYER